MAYNTVLVALFEYVALTQSVVLDWQTVQRWPDGALERFMATGLLVKAVQAGSIECPGCANACFMDIVTLSDNATKPSRAFVVCDDPDMQGEMGRVQIPLAHLQRWQTSLKQLAKVVAALLEFDYSPDNKASSETIRLGMLPSKQGRRWVSLGLNPLCLEVNHRTAPLEEVLYFEGDELTLDRPRINEMLLAAPLQQGKPYTPSTSKREEGKRKTEAMHQDWHDAYLRLKRQNPGKSAAWISRKIEGMTIAQDKTATTIYRKMKG